MSRSTPHISRPTLPRSADLLVVGSGIAGLSFALKAAREGRVLVITKKSRADSSTNWARGGIAAGLGPDDDPTLHLKDTLATGGGLSRPDRVEMVAREGPDRVRELIDWGVRFHREGGRLSLGREGGHSRRRIVRAGDRTGREIERALLAAVAASPEIEVVQHLMAVDLLVEEGACVGVTALDPGDGEPVELRAPVTLLATGGAGQVYRHTTNPTVATGDGVAMAFRAGAPVANMEFVQFHPTALYPTRDPAFLITEALRGEGAVLRRLDGAPLMEGVHARGSLAARDVVARTIHTELARSGQSHVLLDVSAIPEDQFAVRFPGALEGCRAQGVDPYEEGIPVVPAAHYFCGGVVTDEWGRTRIPGLFAAGEVACTGVHGANRLASNSLLEAVVFSHRAVLALQRARDEGGQPRQGWPESQVEATLRLAQARLAGSGTSAPSEGLDALRLRLRDLMWASVGIVREGSGLETALEEIEEMLAAAGDGRTVEAVELRNLLEVSRLVVASALHRRESRGLHYRSDHPEPDDAHFLSDTVLTRG